MARCFAVGRMDERQKGLFRLLVFLARFAVLASVLYIIIYIGVDTAPMQSEVARESHWLISALGHNATVHGAGIVLTLPGSLPLTLAISADCTGWKAMAFFAALLLAVPRRTWKARSVGIAAGIAILWVVNIFRVVAVVSVFAAYGLDAAMLVHDYLWQVGLGASAVVLWAAWLRLSGAVAPARASAQNNKDRHPYRKTRQRPA